MIRLFQVNVGSYLTLDREVLPTDKVNELCQAVRSVSREAVENQVLLTSDGTQMEPGEPIGSYSVGTESKPVFVFFRSCLASPKPPVLTSRLHHSADLHRQLDLLQQKPSPSHFQRQTPLAKRLSDRAVELSKQVKVVLEEYSMQYSGWQSARINGSNIISAFKKHQEVFAKAVEKFEQVKPQYKELLEKFPSQIELLQQLPLPPTDPQGSTILTTPTSTSPTSSLYDWISSYDEKNSLLDLKAECLKSLAQVDGEKLQNCLDTAQQILATTDPSSLSLELQLKQRLSDSKQLLEQAEELAGIQTGLAQSMHVTSQRALRSGEASTIADLTISHHRSLQMMAGQNSQLEDILHKVEEAKLSLTGHIHHRLCEITQLQMKVGQCNSQLVLLHERIKLARRRFEVLKQVVSAPQVLATIIGEVGRRRGFNTALQSKAEEVATLLHRARAEEKALRRSFQASCGQHFVTSLFPELQEKLPDITVHLPRALSVSQTSQSSDTTLNFLREQLPEDIRPPPTTTHSILLESTASSLLSQSSVAVQTEEKESEGSQTISADLAEEKRSGDGQTITKNQPVPETGARDLSDKAGSSHSVERGSGNLGSGVEVGTEVSVGAIAGSQWESGVQYDMYHSAQSSLFESTLKDGSVKVEAPVNTEVLLAAIEECSSKETSVQTEPSVISLEHISVQTESTCVVDNSMQTFATLDESSAQTDRTHWEKDLELSRSMHEELLHQHQDLLSERESLHRTCENLEEKVSSLNEKEQAFSRLRDSLEHLEQQCSEQQKELNETRKSQVKKLAEYEEKLSKSVSLQMEMSQYASEQEQLQAQYERLTGEIKELKEDKSRQLSRHQQAQATLNNMRAQLEQAESRIKMAEGEVALKQALERRLQLSEEKMEKLVGTEERLREAEVELVKARETASNLQREFREKEEEGKAELEMSEKKIVTLERELCEAQKRSELTEGRLAAVEQELREAHLQCKQNESLLSETEAKGRREMERVRDTFEVENLTLQHKLKESEDRVKAAKTDLLSCERQLKESRELNNSLQLNCSELQSKFLELEVREKSGKELVISLEARLLSCENELQAKKDQLNQAEIELTTVQPQVRKSNATISLIEANLAKAEKKLLEERETKITEVKVLKDSLDKTKIRLQESEEALKINDTKMHEAEDTVRQTREKLKQTEDKLQYTASELVEAQSSIQETVERLKQAMEAERELKELRREIAELPSPTGGPQVLGKPPTASVAGSVLSNFTEKVSLASIHVGCVALFMNDTYGNYLGMTVDQKLYYLNQGCVANLQDVASFVPQLGLKRKLLLGRITERVLVEVRKENNRLRVPVGSRLYKVQAETVPL